MIFFDTQQAVSWFTGILEGEGSCNYSEEKHDHRILISNSRCDIVEACVKLLDAWGVFHNVINDTRRERIVHNIQIGGRNNCYTLLKTLGVSFQCRVSEFNQKLNFCLSSRPLTHDLFWMVGVFEAEGTICLVRDRSYYKPVISFRNTDTMIMEKFALCLRALGISWNASSYTDARKQSYKKQYIIDLQSLFNCQRFLRKVNGLWVSAYYGTCAELLKEFCDSRALLRRKPYTERQRDIYQQLRLVREV